MRKNLSENHMKIFAGKSRQAAAAGAVLLKNERETLPVLPDERVALFGRCQIEYYRSGTGSGGAVNVEYASNILDGLKDSHMLYDGEVMQTYTDWIKEHPFDNGGGGWAAEPWHQHDMPIDPDLAFAAARRSDKAVYVIGRTAGEDKDNADSEGSYRLTACEMQNLKTLAGAFDRIAVVLNVSNIIDMHWVDDPVFDGHITAVLYVWQGGQEGGFAAADVLSGAVTPGGKLPDTIAYDIKDYPSSGNFGNEYDNRYEEDIYVGYRYFETFCPEKVQYPFGFGLSYTTFSTDIARAKIENGKITLRVTVTNTGDRYCGSEVVQIYYGAPQGKLGKPARQLAAFKKTRKLEPLESQELEIGFKISDMASYDDGGITGHKSCYVLESGEYEIFAGNSVRDVKKVVFEPGDGVTDGRLYLNDTVVTEQLSEAMAPEENLKILRTGAKKADGTYEIAYSTASPATVDLAERIEKNLPDSIEITGDRGITLQDVRDKKASLDEFIAQLSVEEMAILVRGEGMSNPRVTKGTASAFGGLSDSLFHYGIPAGCTADGPSGMRMEAKSVQLPIGTLLASSWDPDLVRDLYRLEGEELYANNIDTLLGPGVNIHRHPLNGRNFEYYSEDPYLSGVMAVATTGGIKDGGAWGTIKHMALNGQETHRFKINAVCSERAIREIYLKAFEMAVRAGTVRTVMTSYNPVNGHWCASNYDLTTTILRGEWGFKGMVMTDWWARMNDVVTRGEESASDTRDMIRSQNDVYMVVNNNGAEINSKYDNTEESVAAGRLTLGELQRAAKNICAFLLDAPVIERKLEAFNETEEFMPLAGDEDGISPVEPDPDGKIAVGTDTDGFAMEVKEDGVYTVIVSMRSPFTNLAQATCNVYINGVIAFVIQTHGTENRWILQKLVKVKLHKGFYKVRFEHVLSGLEIGYIRFKPSRRG